MGDIVTISVSTARDEWPGSTIETRATAFLPPEGITGDALVVVGFAGAGYNRAYFDVSAGRDLYGSMARYFADQGHVFLAIDHVGTGDSSMPPADGMTSDLMADVDAVTVRGALSELAARAAVKDWSPRLVGVGHSMGGCLLVKQQARHRTFDAVAILGWSSVHMVVPVPPESAGIVDAPGNDSRIKDGYIHLKPRPASLSWAFYLEDTDPDLLALDTTSAFPACVLEMANPGIVSDEAAAIDVPTFLGFGERDVSRNPHAEVAAYPAATDVTLYVLSGAAHCHNYAITRRQLWDRLLSWIGDATDAGPGEAATTEPRG